LLVKLVPNFLTRCINQLHLLGMKSRSTITTAIILALTASAPAISLAQAPPDQSNVAMLEKRVPDELAAEGIVLSRRGVTLKIEAVGASLLLSLVDDASGRVVASTKMDNVPTDREALVASVTHVAADLAAQGAPPAAPVAQNAPAPVDDDLQARKKQYRQQYLHFGEMTVVTGDRNSVSSSLSSIPFRGDMNEVLKNDEFYSIVGRQDLAERYRSRRRTGKILAFGGVLTMLAALPVYLLTNDYGRNGERESSAAPALILIGVGTVGLYAGYYYLGTANGADANQAKGMARDYNEKLQRQLRLEEQARNKRATRDVRVAAYAEPNGGGLLSTGASKRRVFIVSMVSGNRTKSP
jgi:hypothetical protein